MVEEQTKVVSLPGPPSEVAATGPVDTARGTGTSGLPVYAAAAGVISALPVPFLDARLVALVRGAALRRVAHRHGVRLSAEARAVLAAPDPRVASPSIPRRLVQTVLRRSLSSVRIAARVDDGLSTWAAALLLDHYLRTAARSATSPLPAPPILEGEAKRLRSAMSSAAVRGAVRLLRDVPSAVPGILRNAFGAAMTFDSEDRTPVERTVDALLEALADAPAGVGDRLREAFDTALAEAHVSAP